MLEIIVLNGQLNKMFKRGEALTVKAIRHYANLSVIYSNR